MPVAKSISENEATYEEPIPQVKWQQFFKSENLQKIIQTALDNNRDLRVAALNIDAARALYRISRADLVPNIRAGGSMVKQKTPAGANFFNTSTITTTRFDANLFNTAFEVDLFGRIRSKNRAAVENFLATQEAKNAVQISLIAEVANAYLQLLADQEIWQLSKNNVVINQKSFDMVSKKFEFGSVSKLDLAQATTLVEAAKANQALHATRVAQDKNALLLLMGVAKSDLLLTKEKLEDVKLPDNLPAGMSSEALLFRPDIMQAEHDLKSANANIGAARAAFFPTISLTGSIGHASTDLSTLFSGSSSVAWNFSPRISMPIFEGGRNFANLDYAKISKNIYIAKYEKAIQNGFREVMDQLVARKNIDDQLQAQSNFANAAWDAYQISHIRYNEGIDDFTTVATNERQMFAAKQDEISLKKEKLSNLIQLYKALGGGI
ncbi:MAG: efflux system, outer rane lipoprotein CmeC [Rickettsiaceae bacterium]|nr:efflux system, outer rane lipoprotein CmeC [Rickettsiaceae bacterium]